MLSTHQNSSWAPAADTRRLFLAGRLIGPRPLVWLLAADCVLRLVDPRYLPLLVGSVAVNY